MEAGTPDEAASSRSWSEGAIGQGLGFFIVIALLVAAGFLAATLFEGPKINPGSHPSS